MTGSQRTGRVLRATAGFFEVETDDGRLTCRMRGRLKKERRRTDLCVVGDQVTVTETAPGEGTIDAVAPRHTVFSRRHPGGGREREDVLVANLDQLFIVFAFHDPPFHPRMLDRFLVVAEQNDVAPVIVANKLDQAPEAASDPEDQRTRFARYRELDYPVCFASAVTGEGVDSLRAMLPDRVSAFAGPSGVGKSSLLNALEPGLGLAVGGTSESHSKGRHTTRVATLHPVAGGWVADTPGIRELGTWALAPDEIDRCFPDLRPFLADCRFRSCRHDAEPGCAVKAAVEAGDIRPERYDSYLRLLRGDDDG